MNFTVQLYNSDLLMTIYSKMKKSYFQIHPTHIGIDFINWFNKTKNCKINYISWNEITITFPSEEEYLLFLKRWS